MFSIHFGLLMLPPQQARKGLPFWLGLLILIIKEEIWLIPGERKGCPECRRSLRVSLSTLCFLRLNEKLQPVPGRSTNGPTLYT